MNQRREAKKDRRLILQRMKKKLSKTENCEIGRTENTDENYPRRLNASKKMATIILVSPLLVVYIYFFRQMNHEVCSFRSVCLSVEEMVFIGWSIRERRE